jgi:tetratricopeptide (TPR) repeat protein
MSRSLHEASVGIAFLAWLLAPGLIAAPACEQCHAEVVRLYRTSGMSRTFARAQARDEAAGRLSHVLSQQDFEVSVTGGRIAQKRWPSEAPGRIFERVATWAIGSGNHARSFLHAEPNGTLTQLPLTWYSQSRHWAMSPGYDQKSHAGFSRQIDPGCLFCHNSYPKNAAVFGRVTRYEADLPEGIGCERCHGEGSAHAMAPSAKNIVNPRKLPADRALDVCLQCHLETTSAKLPHALRRAGRTVDSFRPGERLDAYLVQFDHPASAGRENKFEINSAGYRMLQSPCFTKGGNLTCSSCHNAHAPAAAQSSRAACQSCHGTAHDPGGDCANCHMPKRRTEDAVHVILTDHRIQKPLADLAALVASRAESITAYRGDLSFYRSGGLRPVDRNLYLGQALALDGADRKRGIGLLERALAQKPVIEGLVALASAYVAEGKPRLALPWFERALAINPGMTQVRYNYALAKASPAELQKVVAAEPDFAEALNSLGALLLPKREAKPYLDRAHAAQPYLPEPLHNLGLLAQASGGEAAARGYFEESIIADPTFAPAYNSYGRLEAQGRRYTEAIAYFERALHLDPDYGEAQYNLGRLLQETGQTPRALRHLEAAVRLKPELPEAQMALGVAYGEADRFAEAARAFAAVVRLQPANTEARRNLELAQKLAKR